MYYFQLRQLQLIFVTVAKNARKVNSDVRNYTSDFFRLLDKIIPNEYFGSLKNRKEFYKIVKKILTQSRLECIYVSALVKSFNVDEVPWMQNELEKSAQMVYLQKVRTSYTFFNKCRTDIVNKFAFIYLVFIRL